MKTHCGVMLTLAILVFLTWVPVSLSCNKALCASDVSKCLIQELCQCRPGEGNCSCCKECMLCLGTLWDECCDCVGMCNPRNYSDTPPTSKSTVEELHEPIPSLFRALTEGDTQLNWNIVSFPVAEELSHHENLVSFLETVNQPHHQNVSVPSNNVHAPYSSDKGLSFSTLFLGFSDYSLSPSGYYAINTCVLWFILMTACPYISVKYPVSPWEHPNIAGSITPAVSALVQSASTMVVKQSNV
ncbi:twisted gastrulation protein homolog 1 isoform X1 [Neovison vison]|uniref:twisted gastrulation protein homolog 1 isoform X1 n=1 Tax=Neovison vison TaxID=452646 RepID=UPI001CF03AD4|nr:twisted gastrulation protein homolog 1 isoform X1 [Neogale vison]XP_044099337.1 twisted gastrulation protein homolog 1 isoform X1 [Neogale vison]XP_044099338.1 twisted gastrulation protein homolog 1 isoform X1 [Neogale vison]